MEQHNKFLNKMAEKIGKRISMYITYDIHNWSPCLFHLWPVALIIC